MDFDHYKPLREAGGQCIARAMRAAYLCLCRRLGQAATLLPRVVFKGLCRMRKSERATMMTLAASIQALTSTGMMWVRPRKHCT